MKPRTTYVTLLALAMGVTVAASRSAMSGSGQSGALVRLQPAFPGVPQLGNANLDGSFRAKTINLDTPNTTAVFAHTTGTVGNSVYGLNETGNYPAVLGFVNQVGNGGLWGNNSATGVFGLVAYNTSGIYGNNGNDSANNAGYFVGKVQAAGFDGSFLASNVFGFSAVATGSPVGTYISAPANQTLGLFTSGAERMRVHPGGGVSISTTDQPSVLTVGGLGYGIGQWEAWGGKLLSTYMDGSGCYFGTVSGDSLKFYTGNSWAQATLTTAGNFGINTETPGSKLEIVEPNTATDVSGAKIYSAGQGFSSTHPGGSFWNGGLEATGPNGMIGGTNFSGGIGVVGAASAVAGVGVYGYAPATSGANYGVMGQATGTGTSYGLYSVGRTGASGTKSFRIDHPQDPTNKYLLHYSAEGPEPLNIYSGNIVTDERGYATVNLPTYFDDINTDLRYQLTVIDSKNSDDFVLAKVVQEEAHNQFVIRTSAPNAKVSWRVEARRNDRFVQKYGAPVEVEKEGRERGTYQDPKLYDAPAEMGMMYQAPSKAKSAPAQIRRRPMPEARRDPGMPMAKGLTQTPSPHLQAKKN